MIQIFLMFFFNKPGNCVATFLMFSEIKFLYAEPGYFGFVIFSVENDWYCCEIDGVCCLINNEFNTELKK